MIIKNIYHEKAPSGTGSLALCGSDTGPVSYPGQEVTCPDCLEILRGMQVGGTHYAEQEIQPWSVMQSMSSRAFEDMFTPFQWHLIFSALKYIMRAGRKGPASEDVNKAIHYLQTLRRDL